MQDPQNDPSQPLTDRETVVIPVVAEQLQVGKEVVETGRVRIAKQVHQEYETVNVPVVQEEVDVRRVPINQYVEAAPPAVRYEGDTMIMTVLQEVMVVEKRLLLVEEVHVTKRQLETQSSQQVALRKESVVVERLDTPGLANNAPAQ